MTRSIWQLAVAAIVILIATAALAQDAAPVADGMAGKLWDFLGGLSGVLAIIIVGGLTWLASSLAAYLKDRHSEAIWSGILIRFNTALLDAVRGEVAVLKARFADAKDPASPGGERITKAELDEIGEAAWEHLKAQYGGVDGIKQALGIIAGDDVERWVRNKINGAVAIVESDTPKPRDPT